MPNTNASNLNKGIVLRFMKEALAQFVAPPPSVPNYNNLAFYTFVRLREAGLLPEAGLTGGPIRSLSDLSNEHPLMILLTEAYHHLFLSGYIAPRPPGVGERLTIDFFVVTDVGHRWATSSSDPMPEDPQGYLATLTTLVPAVDPVIQQYVEEALLTYDRRALFASAVMIGAASEKAIYLLMDALHGSVANPAKKQAIERAIERRGLPTMFERLEENMTHAKSLMPYAVHEGADCHLLSLQDAIRVQRNDAVHPEAGRVGLETVRLALSAFPYACKKIYDLIHWFNHNTLP